MQPIIITISIPRYSSCESEPTDVRSMVERLKPLDEWEAEKPRSKKEVAMGREVHAAIRKLAEDLGVNDQEEAS